MQSNPKIAAFVEAFDTNIQPMLDNLKDAVIEFKAPTDITRESLLAQLLMEELFIHPCDPEWNGDLNTLGLRTKTTLLAMAHHMGPDYCQALYRAAVFMTKVA